MKYHFEYDAKGRRLFVAELDNELDNIDASDEEIVDCTGECFQDMTVIFDVDRYINLYQALRGLMKIEREFGIVQMTATIRSVSGSLEFALIGCCVEVYSFGNLDITAKWFWQNTPVDFSVVLDFPADFYIDPAAWFEREMEKMGVHPYVKL